ncbi:MAG: hypothetical protein IKP43_00295 [Bacteroidaceae bacterium]|nr:hypothetical protein [Bacteroidaceae bacterium]
MAEATDDVELKISALCKAILSEPNDDYLGEVHLALAKTLISTNQKVIAKRELNKFKETYQRKGWKPKEGYILMSKEISDITDTSSDNKDFYSAHLFPAEEFVYSEIEWTTMVVSDVYKQKKDGRERERAKLVSADGKEVSVRFETLKIKAKKAIGSCYDVKIIDHEDRYDIGMIRESEKTIIDIFTPVTCYVDYHNKERKCFHLITNDNKQVVLSQQVELKEGQFCSCYIMPQKENDKAELPIHALFSRIEDPKTALQSFTMRTAVVDHVNKSKQLFQCVFGLGMDIIVYFSQTDLRPLIGDYVQIRYVRKKLKDGRVIRKMLSIEPTDSCEKELKKLLRDTSV